ncbi:CvpA family protein [Candidatus Woesebacteria bacterium]|nr:CvpA family protein [Candidatus Woesebacteria bacterium]
MNLNGNWVDLAIILVLASYASDAFRRGFWAIVGDFVAFFGSLLIALRLYQFTSGAIETNFGLTHSISNAVGFLITAIFIQFLLSYAFSWVFSKIPEKILKHKLNKLLGIAPALGEGIIIVSFFLTLVVALPLQPWIKRDVTASRIGSYLIKQTAGIEKAINQVFGGVIEDSLTSRTIRPGSGESITLTSEVQELTVDEASEAQMFALVNEERRKRGIKELTWAPNIVPVARAHARDMWERKYFSHYSPEGKDVGDRLEASGINYQIAGENLALAPTVATAHNGLMNSEGHRANILEPSFSRMGIGVIDNGIYGKMFVQVFTD